jgi:hypothetical protein
VSSALRASAALCLVAACFHPNAATGQPCSPTTHDCPTGQSCDVSASPPTCVTALRDGGIDDAPPDARVLDAAVGCTSSTSCPAPDPFCDTGTGTCRPCRADVECTSAACEESTGTCVAEADVLYVNPAAGSNAVGCTRALPCGTIQSAVNATATTTRAFIAIAAGTYNELVQYNNGTTSLELSGPGSGSVAAVTMGIRAQGNPTSLLVESLTVNTTAAANPCIDLRNVNTTALTLYEDILAMCTNSDAVDANGPLTMTRCHLIGSGAANNNHGVSANATVQIEQSIFEGFRDGVAANSGTLRNDLFLNNSHFAIRDQVGGGSQGSNVTVIDFVSGIGNSQAVQCNGPTLITNSLFADASTHPQLQPVCDASYSLWDDNSTPTGSNNLAAAIPMFVNAVGGDYHLAAGSPGVGAGDPASPVTVDLDGAVRPSGGGFDIGAFQGR